MQQFEKLHIMNKIKLFVVAIVAIFAATACSPIQDTEHVMQIKNESSHEITIKGALSDISGSYVYWNIQPKETKQYLLVRNIWHYMINFDGQITTCHTWYDKSNPHSLGGMIGNIELYEPTIEGNRHIYEFVFTDADYEYALEHPFDHWDKNNWLEYVLQ